MSVTASPPPGYDIFRPDRPGWIPESVGDDWDPDPYAYQTQEELMPAGRFHNLYLQILAEMLGPLLGRMGLEAVIDVFIFYRDPEGRKQRIAPDMVIAPVTELSDEQKARSYDLDVEPLPPCVIEIVSPRSREYDLEQKPFLYAFLGIDECVVLDILGEQGRVRPQIGVTLWRLGPEGMAVVPPDDEGSVTLETIDVRLRADGQRLVARIASTGELLRSSTELLAALEESEQARTQAEQRADVEAADRAQAEQRAGVEAAARAQAERRADAEAAARAQAEQELARLRAELERLRGSQG